MIKFSVIVPVYKVEQWLDRCMESITNQTYRELEIIMVDDGSPDACPGICEAWKRRDDRVRVIHKENEGLALARNSGLGIATGDYVSFVDSDDYLMPELYALAAEELEKTNADICSFGHCTVGQNGEMRNAPMDYPEFVSGERVITELLPRTCGTGLANAKKTYSLVPAWSSMYRRAFLNDHSLRFQRIVSEDKLFNLQAYHCAGSVAFIARPLYAYCENTSSLTKIYRPYLFDSACDLYQMQKELVRQWGLGAVLDHAVYASFLTHVHACLKQESRFAWAENNGKAKRNMKTVCNSAFTQEAVRRYPMGELEWKKRIFYGCIRLRLVRAVRLMLRTNDALGAKQAG